jgi:hypothetical protein
MSLLQLTSRLLMIRPANFGFNEETAENNVFQFQPERISNNSVVKNARKEFDVMVQLLKDNKVDVLVLEDSPDPVKPDALFPNNWFSVHGNTLVTYPMFAKNRRIERNQHHIEKIKEYCGIRQHFQLEHYERADFPVFLEGTGSLVLDRENKIAFAALSVRTHELLVKEWCALMGYEPMMFVANGPDDLPIYHTNVMMCVGQDFAVVCLECIPNGDERNQLKTVLKRCHKEIIELSLAQTFQSFAGNMLQIKNKEDKKILVMSDAAFKSLKADQLSVLNHHNDVILPIAIPTIEQIGGGSVRCMLAEL